MPQRFIIQMKLFKQETKSKKWVDIGYYPGKNPGPYLPYSYPGERWAKEQMFLKRRANRIEGRDTEYRLRPVEPGENTEYCWFSEQRIKFLEERTPSFHKTNNQFWEPDGTLKLD